MSVKKLYTTIITSCIGYSYSGDKYFKLFKIVSFYSKLWLFIRIHRKRTGFLQLVQGCEILRTVLPSSSHALG